MNLNSEDTIYFGNNKDDRLSQVIYDFATDLKRIANLYVNDMADCEDIIQKECIGGYQKNSKYRHEARCKTGLIRITINNARTIGEDGV